MDSAKWHCCQMASSSLCKNLCSKTFTRDWSTSWEEFHNKCLTQISEENLRTCIDEGEFQAYPQIIYFLCEVEEEVK